MIKARRMIAMLGLFLPFMSWAGTVDLPETGQTTCFNDVGTIPCAGTGQDGEKQAGVSWPSTRFTNNGDGTVTDNLTGLVWLRNGNCFGLRMWSQALSDANGLADGSCGLSDGSSTGDWRFPNVNELESLVNAEETNIANWLNSQEFTNVQSDFYWSSTWREGSQDVLGVGMGAGGIIPLFVDDTYSVWAVRAGQTGSSDPTYPANIWKTGQTTCFNDVGTIPCAGTGQDGEKQAGVSWPLTRFTNNGDGTVTDNLTGLVWLRNGNCFGLRMWSQALSDANGLADGSCGLSDGSSTGDWRLSNRKELRSLYNYADPLDGFTTNAAWLNDQGFINVFDDNYWTSTTISNSTTTAWRITLADKELAESTKNSDHFVWPVRGGTIAPKPDITVTDSVVPVDDLRVPFGDLAEGNFSDQTVTITNHGEADLDIYNVAQADSLLLPFEILNDGCSEKTLTIGASCILDVRFLPTAKGVFNDSFDMPSNDPDENPIIVYVSGSNIGGGIIELPQTGQTICYDELGDVTSCSNTGQDGDIQAGVSWPSTRFADNGDGTVTDNLTGLVWLKDGNCFGSDTWQNALDTVADFNANPGNYTCQDYTVSQSDWRLPNINELESLVNAGEANEAAWLINKGFVDVLADEYWSSTTDNLFTDEARSVYMSSGSMFRGSKEYDNSYMWPVRAGQMGSSDPAYPANIWKTGQTECFDETGSGINCTDTGQDGDIQAGVSWPSPRFTDNGEGTVTDNLTGLVWLKDGRSCGGDFGSDTWQNALDTVADFNANPGNYICQDYTDLYNDWRLPNRKELYSLYDFSQDSPALPAGNPFVRPTLDFYWSSTNRSGSASSAWRSYMEEGFVDLGFKSDNYWLWPVRSGQEVSIIPGDSNGDELVDAGDLTALVLEIFDLDGNLPADAPGGGFAGTAGADANEDGVIDAGDLSCTVLIIFNGQGACGAAP